MGGNLAFQSSYRVAADFSSASNLVPGDDVTVSGWTVGAVAWVEPTQGGARIALQMMQRYAAVYQEARAMAKINNVLDESYVELFRGTSTSGPLPEGGTIPQSRTLTPVELAQVLDVLNAGTRDQLASVIDNLGESVSGRGQQLNDTAGALKTTSLAQDRIAHAIAHLPVHRGSRLHPLSKSLLTPAP